MSHTHTWFLSAPLECGLSPWAPAGTLTGPAGSPDVVQCSTPGGAVLKLQRPGSGPARASISPALLSRHPTADASALCSGPGPGSVSSGFHTDPRLSFRSRTASLALTSASMWRSEPHWLRVPPRAHEQRLWPLVGLQSTSLSGGRACFPRDSGR